MKTIYYQKGAQLKKVESTNKRKIDELVEVGFKEVKLDGKGGIEVVSVENTTIAKLKAEIVKLKAENKKLKG